MKLTSRQQNLIAEVASHFASIAYHASNGDEKQFADCLDRLSTSWAVDAQPNEWSVIYDIMHRSGANQ